MKTNDKIKEIPDDFLLYYNDFIGEIEFADAFKHLAVNPDNPLVIEHMYHWLQHRLETLVREEREEERANWKRVLADDSCECDNCHRTRRYLKNPKKELHKLSQRSQALYPPPITNTKN